MEKREREILAKLFESDNAFYIPADMSDVYAIAPDNMLPGLICVPGEYEGMTLAQVNYYVLNAMRCGAFTHIPYAVDKEVADG